MRDITAAIALWVMGSPADIPPPPANGTWQAGSLVLEISDSAVRKQTDSGWTECAIDNESVQHILKVICTDGRHHAIERRGDSLFIDGSIAVLAK